ncbi:MAG: dienelactone hydrolase family protein [Rhodospirillaceae bacterium]|nr:dienelactone hydrolase family protein [Rhodospirillaceae bacterium]MCY4238866.1 dienelactone hydrolase family protein [Rhodospirillaceae bacterium]MCY4311251.1 dienelactone hydrolase family protein [Rhodospirillaceae bacterium]
MPEITIDGQDGRFKAYRADPTGASGPAIVVIQEIFGVNKVMRDISDWWARQGYIAICPDIFWRQEPGIQLTDQSEAEWQRAFELYQGFDEAKGIEDIQATINTIRNGAACTGKVGTVGFCLGGKLAYLCSTRTDADANVGYYGVGIENALDEAGNISKPTMLHIAEEDGFCPQEAQTQIHASLDGHVHVTIHDYPGVDHAFARPGGEHYNSAAAQTANDRSADFFKSHLS